MYELCDKLILNACHSNNELVHTYFHNTNSLETAKSILKTGFTFKSHLGYCCDIVYPLNESSINNFSNNREDYGAYTIIIQISKSIISDVSDKLKKNKNSYSEVLCHEKATCKDEELIHTLALEFVTGFVNQQNLIFNANPNFNPNYYHNQFDVNVNLIRKH